MTLPKNGKRLLFVQEYLIDLNATQAALRAGYSPKTAYAMGHELLKKPEIQEAVQEAFVERAKRIELTQDHVVEGLRFEALYFGKGNTPSARVAAWAHLGKHLGMFIEKHQWGNDPENPPRVIFEVVYGNSHNGKVSHPLTSTPSSTS